MSLCGLWLYVMINRGCSIQIVQNLLFYLLQESQDCLTTQRTDCLERLEPPTVNGNALLISPFLWFLKRRFPWQCIVGFKKGDSDIGGQFLCKDILFILISCVPLQWFIYCILIYSISFSCFLLSTCIYTTCKYICILFILFFHFAFFGIVVSVYDWPLVATSLYACYK